MKTAAQLKAQWEAGELAAQQKYKDAAVELVDRLEKSGQRSVALVQLIDPQTAKVLRDNGYTVKEPKQEHDQREGESWITPGTLSF